MTDACIFIRPKSSRCTWNDGILPKASECETLLLWQNGALTWEPLSYNLDNIHIAQYVRTLEPGQRPEDYRFPRGYRTSRERARRTVLAARKRAEGLHPAFFDEGGDGDLVEKKKNEEEEEELLEEAHEEDGDAVVAVVNGEHGELDDDSSMTTIAVPTAVAPVLQAILRNFTLTPRPGPPSGGVSRSVAPSPLPTPSCNASSSSSSSPPPPDGALPPPPPPPLMTPDSDAILADCAAQIIVIADSDSTTFVGFSDDDDDNPDVDDDTPGPDTASESESEPEYYSPQYFGGLEATTPPGSPSRGSGCTGW